VGTGLFKNLLCLPRTEWVPDSLQSWEGDGGEEKEKAPDSVE